MTGYNDCDGDMTALFFVSLCNLYCDKRCKYYHQFKYVNKAWGRMQR